MKAMTEKKQDEMEKELNRRSIGPIIGALFLNPGSISYLLSKWRLRKHYQKKKEQEESE
jgi:hypothetical protein